ncbi:MAG TPA: transposase [Candidatus Coprocola pullicola]|nr:transposase [Candidatus Coprocola pullicola]
MCKYPIVFTSKSRRKTIYSQLYKDIQKIIKDLCKSKRLQIIKGYMRSKHVYILSEIPSKINASSFVV